MNWNLYEEFVLYLFILVNNKFKPSRKSFERMLCEFTDTKGSEARQ
jgi:hypothetical protein